MARNMEAGVKRFYGGGGVAGMLGMKPWYEQDPMDIAQGFMGATGPINALRGMAFPAAQTGKRLAVHNRNQAQRAWEGTPYPGGPKNPRTIIPAPPGSDLPDVPLGEITPQDWVNKMKGVPSAVVHFTSKWYKDVYPLILQATDGNVDETRRMAGGFLASNAGLSPSNAMHNMLQIKEQLQRGVPPDELRGRGYGVTTDAVSDVLRDETVRHGVGLKLADFSDAAAGLETRSVMGRDPSGGSPIPIDRHTARDTGLVDQTFLNSLEAHGYDVPPGINIDFTDQAGLTDLQYQNRSDFGQTLTAHLNKIGWRGRSDWAGEEWQAAGWDRMANLFGGGGPSAANNMANAIALNTRSVSMEVDPSKGSPWDIEFGPRLRSLPDAEQYAINDKVTRRAIEMATRRHGVDLRGVVHGTGGWELLQNPSTVHQGLNSRQGANRVASDLLGLLNQSEVLVDSVKELTENPQAYAIDIIEANGGTTLRDSGRLTELWDKIKEAEGDRLVRGYHPIQGADGEVGIRILVPDYTMKEWAEDNGSTITRAKELVVEFYETGLDDILDGFEYNSTLLEAVIDRHRQDWEANPNGPSVEDLRDPTGTSDAASNRALYDSDRSELTEYVRRLIGEAEAVAHAAPEGAPTQGVDDATSAVARALGRR